MAIAYLSEDDDAEHTKSLVEAESRRCLLLPGDLADAGHCADIVKRTVEEFGGLDVLVNNVAYQEPQDSLDDIDEAQWARTFDVNVHSFYRVTRAALPHLQPGSAIINTASINGLRGNKTLIDYSATKGAVITLTYSLAQSLNEAGIRVNCVAPGPVWTPSSPATMDEDKVKEFGAQVPYGRPASAGRDRAVVRVLRLRPDVVVLLRRGPGTDRRGNPAGLIRIGFTRQRPGSQTAARQAQQRRQREESA